MNKNIFYDPGELRSKQRIFNFIIGMRGNGKTYSMKKMCIKNFLNKNEQFVWVRRYKTELGAEFARGWGEDIQNEFPNIDIQVTKKHIKINDKIAGFVIPLSTSQRMKSVSYAQVTSIVFDEFLITSDGGNLHYIKDEPVLFLELFSTVARMRDNVNAFFVANAFSVVNPYFVYHNIEMDITQRFTMNEHVCIELTHTPGVQEAMNKTRYGKLISNTKYGEYAINAKFFNDDDKYIRKRSGSYTYMMTIYYRDEKLGVWVAPGLEYWYVDKLIETNCEYVLSMTTEDMIEGARFKKSETLDMFRMQLRLAFNEGLMYYSDNHVKKLMYEFVHMI